jgi:CBS domain containing-hemolysin-like protein
MDSLWLGPLALALALALSFFLSGMEAGVFALNPVRIRHWMRTGKPRARVLQGFLERPENFFWTILVGNTLANFVAVVLVVLFLHRQWGHQPALALAVFLSAVFCLFATCELLPKMLFRAAPNRLCLSLVGLFRVVHAALQPLVRSLYWLSRLLLRWTGGRTDLGQLFSSREELRQALQETGQNLTTEEQAMINRVLDLHGLKIGQLMTPLAQAVTVHVDTPMREALRLCREKRLTRLPVWQGDAGNRRVAGVVSLKTLLYLSDLDLAKTAGHYVKPALYLPEEMRVEEALRRIRRGGQRLTIVLGRAQQEIGVVTLEDILKVIFGEVNL